MFGPYAVCSQIRVSLRVYVFAQVSAHLGRQVRGRASPPPPARRRFIIGIEPRDRDLIGIYSEDILRALQRGSGAWEAALPEGVVAIIKAKRLFGYGSV